LNATGGPNSTPTLEFNGTTMAMGQDLASGSQWLPPDANMCAIFVVEKLTSYTATAQTFCQLEPTAIIPTLGATTQVNCRQTTGNEDCQAAAPAVGTKYALVMEYVDGAFMRNWVNNNVPVTAFISDVAEARGTRRIGLGSAFNASQKCPCRIAEFILFQNPTDTRLTLLGNYLNTRYGFSLSWGAPIAKQLAIPSYETILSGKTVLRLNAEPENITYTGTGATGDSVITMTNAHAGGPAITLSAATNRPTLQLADTPPGGSFFGAGHRPVLMGNGTQYIAGSASIIPANTDWFAYLRMSGPISDINDVLMYLAPCALRWRTSGQWGWRDDGTGEEALSVQSGTGYFVIRVRRVDDSQLGIRVHNLPEVLVSLSAASSALDAVELFAKSGASIGNGSISDLIVGSGSLTATQDRQIGDRLNFEKRSSVGWG
jgi:hypothetical protein